MNNSNDHSGTRDQANLSDTSRGPQRSNAPGKSDDKSASSASPNDRQPRQGGARNDAAPSGKSDGGGSNR